MAGEYKVMIIARLVVTFAVLVIAAGLLFIDRTEVSMNIASGILGGLTGYWFSTDSAKPTAKEVENASRHEDSPGKNSRYQNSSQ